jgi:hypothetical protein
MCVCQGTPLPSDEEDTTPTEQFTKRMERVTALPPPTLEEVQIQMEASARWRKEHQGE